MWPFKKKQKNTVRQLTRDELIESIMRISKEKHDLTYEEITNMRVGLEQTDTESLAMIFAMFSFAE
jgi:hypothetical protein